MSPCPHAARERGRNRGPDGARPPHGGPGSVFLLVTLLLLLLAGGCRRERSAVVLASTTSTEDSGLFDALLPAFSAAHPEYAVQLIAVGSGQALELGARGDADVLLVHSPAAEAEFMAAGHGVTRAAVMHNDYVILGPAEDPAGARGRDAVHAFRRIAAAGGPFISRGDGSGTEAKELALWARAGLVPAAPWHVDVGQGMGETLAIAGERRAYTLADRGTYLFLRERDGLEVLVEGDPLLFNPYHVIVPRQARNTSGGRAFATWITGPAARTLIGRHGVERYGQPLFTPVAAAR